MSGPRVLSLSTAMVITIPVASQEALAGGQDAISITSAEAAMELSVRTQENGRRQMSQAVERVPPAAVTLATIDVAISSEEQIHSDTLLVEL